MMDDLYRKIIGILLGLLITVQTFSLIFLVIIALMGCSEGRNYMDEPLCKNNASQCTQKEEFNRYNCYIEVIDCSLSIVNELLRRHK